ncbi:hypothetical protein VTH06DRAFT_3435 [Thermothelomyces fergusii]
MAMDKRHYSRPFSRSEQAAHRAATSFSFHIHKFAAVDFLSRPSSFSPHSWHFLPGVSSISQNRIPFFHSLQTPTQDDPTPA